MKREKEEGKLIRPRIVRNEEEEKEEEVAKDHQQQHPRLHPKQQTNVPLSISLIGQAIEAAAAIDCDKRRAEKTK